MVSLKVLMPCRAYKHWDISLFLSAQQCKQHVREYVLTVPLGSPDGWGLHGARYQVLGHVAYSLPWEHPNKSSLGETYGYFSLTHSYSIMKHLFT